MARRLPRATTRMVGRDAELAQLGALLDRESAAAICGMAGVGKSRLALAYAEQWAGPTCWVAVAALPDDARAVVGEVCRQLGVAHYDEELAAVIDRERALVVLDDVHLQPSLLEGLRGLRRGRVIATSRARVEGAHVVLEPLAREAAAELCAGLATLYGPGLLFEEAWSASRGNPLLLRQAHIGGVGDRNPLDEVCRQLAGGARALALALALSAAPVAHEVVDARAADELCRRLIAERVDAGYAMHDLIREALLRGASADELEGVRARLIDALRGPAAYAAERMRLLRGRASEIAAILSEVGSELMRAGADDTVLRELEALPPEVMTLRLRLLHARTLCHGLQFRRAYERLVAIDAPTTESALLLGNVATWAGELSHAEAVLGTLAMHDDPATRGRAALGLAWVRINRGTWSAADRLEGAPALYAASLRLCDALLREDCGEGLRAARVLLDGPRPEEPWARLLFPIMLAPMLARAGELEEAERAVAWLEVGQVRERAEIRIARAIIAIERGERLAAIPILRATIRLFERGSFFAGAAWVRTTLARVLYQLGRRREAAALLDELRARCAAHDTRAYDIAIAMAEQQDPLHPAWLDADDEPPAAKRGDAIRAQIRRALRAVASELELPDVEIPESADFALDRACALVGRAARARRHGQRRVAAQHLQQAEAEAAAGEIDAELVAQLYAALDRSTAAVELAIDRERHEVSRGERRLSLATRPALRALLYAFDDREVLSHDELAEALWQTPYDPERHASTLKSHVRRLRVLLGELDLEILPEPGGYRLAPRRIGQGA